jgi:HEPN domain-containing protein
MFKANDYIHALFFSHLVLEKLCKAHWVKNNAANTPPKIHNLTVLASQANLQLPERDLEFLSQMNQFQLEGRYPDYTNKLYKVFKAAQTKDILNKVNTLRKCLLKDL